MQAMEPLVKKTIQQIITNQLRQNDPPETKETLNRLIAEGYSRQKARDLISVVIFSELREMLAENRMYDNEKYVAALKKLPDLSGLDK